MRAAYYFLRGRKDISHTNMNEESKDKHPLRFVWSILGKNKWLRLKQKYLCAAKVFTLVLIVYYDIEEWPLFFFSLYSGFSYFITCERCSCCATFILMG